MAIWNAVKNIRIEKRSKGAHALIELVTTRSSRFQTELVALRPLTPPGDSRRALEAVISVMRTLPVNIKGMEFWCNDAQQAFCSYIDSFVYDAPHAQQRKAPFIYLEDLKDILQIAESRMSMPMGVQTITNLCLAARRTLIVQISALNTNNFDFGYARSLQTNKLVSASFNPVNIIERQVFDLVLSSSSFAELNLSCVAELLIIRSHGNNSLAICRVETTGQRSLMFPNFRGDEFKVTRTADTITLSSPSHSFSFQSHTDELEHWYMILRNLFDAETSGTNSRNEYDSLGISITKRDPKMIAEQQLVRDESYDSFTPKPSGLTKREVSLNNLKRISIGLPSGFTDDLKEMLKDLQEEEQERTEKPAQALAAPVLPPQVNNTPSPSILYAQASDEVDTDMLQTPASLKSTVANAPFVIPSPPSEKLNGRQPSPAEIERANEARRRIGNSILAREMRERQEKVSQPVLSKSYSASSNDSAATSVLFSSNGLIPCSESLASLTSKSVPNVSVIPTRPWANNTAANSCESLPTDISKTEVRQPPSIPPPALVTKPAPISARLTASLTPVDLRAESAGSTKSALTSDTDTSSSTDVESSGESSVPGESKKAKFKSFMKKLKMEMSDPKMLSAKADERTEDAAPPAEVAAQETAALPVSETPAVEPEVKPLAPQIQSRAKANSTYQRPLYALYKSTSMQSLNSNLSRPESSGSGLGTAVCSDSNNRTIAVGAQFGSNGSLASSAGSYQSMRSLKSSARSVDTLHTSVGSSKTWESFLNGVKDEAVKTVSQANSDRSIREEAARKLRQQEEKRAEEIKLAGEKAKQEQAKRTLDPGSVGLVTTTEPAIRRVVEGARRQQAEEDAVFMATATTQSIAVPRVREIRTAKSIDSIRPASTTLVSPTYRGSATFGTNFSSLSTPTLTTSQLPPGMFSAQLWVSKWTVSRWVPLSQMELKIELIPLGRGIAKVNIHSSSDIVQLTVGGGADVRRSGRHDIQVRIGEETYMFRARAADTANKFYACISAARTHEPSLAGSKDSDDVSISTLSTSDAEMRRRTYVPPSLCKPRRAITVSSSTIYEET